VIEYPADRHQFSRWASDGLVGAGVAGRGRNEGLMTTALWLVLPVIGMVALGVAAMFAVRSNAVEFESINAVWPTVLEALPPVEHDYHHETAAISQAA
jgi:hypothetical protein